MGKQHFLGADLELKVIILGCLVVYDTPSCLLEVFCEEITIVTLIHKALSLLGWAGNAYGMNYRHGLIRGTI